MKKIIALALSVLMILTCLVGCKDKANEDLANAVAYLENMYQTGSKDEPMVLSVDKDVLSVVTVDGVSYSVEWAITVTEGASDAVVIAESETENCVKIDIPDLPEEDILFTATATVKDEKDNSEVAEFSYKVKGIEVADDADVEAILNDAYALEEGASMEEEVTLTGKITSVDTAYSDQYKNITVTIVIEGYDDKPIKCYRLAGDGADTLAVGDTITVTGTITNYQGTIEFGQGCTVKEIVKGDGTGTTTSTPSGSGNTTTSTPSGSGNTTTSTPSGSGNTTTSTPSGSTTTELKLVTDQAKILKDAFALGRNETTPYIAQLTGKVISVDKPYNDQYGSICVTMTVGDKNIVCWNMKGDGTNKVKAGDTITVVGVIKNYYYDDADTTGEVEFTYDEASQTEVKMIKLVPGVEENKALTIVNTPVVGTTYKFGMIQENVDSQAVCYLTGAMKNTYYFGTTTAASAAIDVTLEQANGGYYLSTTINGAKKYINMVVSGTHENAVYQDAPSTVYTYDATLKTLVTTLNTSDGTAKYAFGSYGTYTTVCPLNVEDDLVDFYCHFYK